MPANANSQQDTLLAQSETSKQELAGYQKQSHVAPQDTATPTTTPSVTQSKTISVDTTSPPRRDVKFFLMMVGFTFIIGYFIIFKGKIFND